MEWNVYNYNFNKNKIELYNIFNHWNFIEYVKKHIRKYKNKDEFAEKLRKELFYYFGSKCEWELIIEITGNNRAFLRPWVGCRNPEDVRIDVTDEDFDWRSFAGEHISRQIYYNEAKIDVHDQVMWRWEEFLDYVWDNRKAILKLE